MDAHEQAQAKAIRRLADSNWEMIEKLEELRDDLGNTYGDAMYEALEGLLPEGGQIEFTDHYRAWTSEDLDDYAYFEDDEADLDVTVEELSDERDKIQAAFSEFAEAVKKVAADITARAAQMASWDKGLAA